MKNRLVHCLFMASCLAAAVSLSAGSIDYLSNQNASFFFSTAQVSSTDGAGIITFNPAGSALLEPGLHLNFSTQSLLKFYTESESAVLNNEYKQNEPTVILPSLSLVYNFGMIGAGNLAVYMNGGVCAGGGGLNWKDGTVGTNAFKYTIASLSTSAPQSGSTSSVEASSIYYGLGGGLAYTLFDNKLSASAGVRYTIAKRSGKVNAHMNFLNATYGAWTFDADYDYEYSAAGFTPVFGLDIRPIDKLTIGMRYEMETNLEFEYTTNSFSAVASNVNFAGVETQVESMLNQDGKKANQNLPQVISVGAEYVFTPKFTLSVATNLYLMGLAETETTAGVDLSEYFGTGYELCLAGQYQLTEKMLLGGTFMYSNQGVKKSYFESSAQLMTVSANPPLNSITTGAGAKYNVFGNLNILLSGAYVYYIPMDATVGSLKVTYEKQVFNLGFAADYKF